MRKKNEINKKYDEFKKIGNYSFPYMKVKKDGKYAFYDITTNKFSKFI